MKNQRKNIKIRTIKETDLPEIQELVKELDYSPSIEEIEYNIRLYRNSKKYSVLVAEKESMVIGFVALHIAEFFHHKANMMRIMGLVVDKRYRRCGVGKLLMQHAENWANRHACYAIELTSGTRRKMSGTHDFYDNLGYKNEGEYHKTYLRKVLKDAK